MATQTPSSVQYRLAPSASSAQKTVHVVGDAWTLKVLRALFRGKARFSDFVVDCGVSRAVLTDRLARLIGHEVVSRVVVEGGHPSYRLTDRGVDLWSLFLAMWLWETDWDKTQATDTWATQTPRAQARHVGCGHAMRPTLNCQHCAVQVSPFDTKVLTQSANGQYTPSSAMSSAFRKDRSSDGLDSKIQKLIRVMGDRWNAAVVATSFKGIRTFSGFEQELGIRPAQLSNRLTELVNLGILRLQAKAGGRQEYRLTQAGIALYGITLELVRWGNHWLSSEHEQLRILHLPCGHELITRWCCGHCGHPLTRESLHYS